MSRTRVRGILQEVVHVALKPVALGKRTSEMLCYTLKCGHVMILTPDERARHGRGEIPKRKYCTQCMQTPKVN